MVWCLTPQTIRFKGVEMNLDKSGGPANPTLSGGQVDENSFRWEGITVFDYFVGRLLQSGKSPSAAILQAVEVMKLRNNHLMEKEDGQ